MQNAAFVTIILPEHDVTAFRTICNFSIQVDNKYLISYKLCKYLKDYIYSNYKIYYT